MIKLNENTAFKVPDLIQLFYVEDNNKKAVGLYKDLETAEKMEMKTKGKKYTIQVDRKLYNSEKINVSNARQYIKENVGELQQVQAGEVIKLQKPQQDTYTDIITNNDGVEIGTCSVCGANDVIVADHICKTVVQPFESIKNKYGTTANKMLTKIEWFKNVVLENKTK